MNCYWEPYCFYYNGFRHRMLESYFPLLVKLGAMASLASLLARSGSFKSMLMRESRTLNQRMALSAWLSVAFGASVAIRVVSKNYPGADLGLEGALIGGILGGYVTGLASGVLISIPAMIAQQHLTMPLLAAVGVLGGVLRDLAPSSEEIWRFTPFFDLNVYRFFKESKDPRRTAFHLEFFAGILVAEFLRQILGEGFPREVYFLPGRNAPTPTLAATYAATLFAVAIPLKIWNNTRNEKKLEEQAPSAGGSPPGGAHQPDQPALPVQHPEHRLLADPHRPGAGARHGDPPLQSAPPPAAQARTLQPAARRAEFHRRLPGHRSGPIRREAAL